MNNSNTLLNPIHPAEFEVYKPEESEQLITNEYLGARINEALTSCEFQPTPEIKEAVAGFYEDHYALATIISESVDGNIDDDKIDQILSQDNGPIPTTELQKTYSLVSRDILPNIPSAYDAVRIMASVIQSTKMSGDTPEKQRETIIKSAARAFPVLFNESSLGVTTLGPKEQEVIDTLHDKIAAAALDAGATQESSGDIIWRDESGNREAETRLISADLAKLTIGRSEELFWKDCRSAGQLEFHNTGHLPEISMSGSLKPRTEQFKDGKMNAQTAADPIMHSVVPHFSESYDPSGGKSGSPEMDKSLYGSGTVAIPLGEIIKVAPFARDAEYVTVSLKDTALSKIPTPKSSVASIGFGDNDNPGENGPDRVFYASNTEANHDKPDGYSLKLNKDTILIFLGDEEVKRSPNYGLGENMPGRLHIPLPDEAQQRIQELQDTYHDKYKNMFVIPLRRGVFDFIPENAPINFGNRRPAQFVKNPTILDQ